MPTSFPFLDLPPEIREKIYIILCTREPNHPHGSYIYLHDGQDHEAFPHDMLLVNSQIYQELRPIYFTYNKFSMTILKSGRSISYFMSPLFQDNRRQIRTLRVVFARWGTMNFYFDHLIPMLEDCILNGRLRILEVSLTEKFLEALVRRISHEGYSGYEHERWKVLKKIMRDPYLEEVKLLMGSESFETGGQRVREILTAVGFGG